jgi:hypothetical protein
MASKKQRPSAPANRRAKLTGEKTKQRLRAEARVDEGRRLRKQRAESDIALTGGSVEDYDPTEGGLVDVGLVDTDPGRLLRRSVGIGEDVDISDPEYLSEQFDVSMGNEAQRIADYVVSEDKSLGGFLPGLDVSSSVAQRDMPAQRAGTPVGDILKEESIGRAAETPRIKSPSTKAARRTQIKRAASDTRSEADVIVGSADRPPGFQKATPYSVGSVEKSAGITDEVQKERLVKEVTQPGYIDKTKRRSPLITGDGGRPGPFPGKKSAEEATSWKPEIPRVARGQRITFPTQQEASEAAQVVSALGSMFGQTPVSPETTQAAVEDVTTQVRRNVPLRTREGFRITPDPDEPKPGEKREPFLMDPRTDEGALRESVARRRSRGSVGVTYIPKAKTSRTGSGSAARLVNPASADVDPANPTGTPMRTDILQSNLREYQKAGFQGTRKQMVNTMGIDEVTSEIAEREVAEMPLGLKAYDEMRPLAQGGPRIGGVQPPDIGLQGEGGLGIPVPYDYPRSNVGRRSDPGRSMPTPSLRGIEELRGRGGSGPKVAAALEAGMYKGTAGPGDTIKWERGEVPVWRRGTETAPGTTPRTRPAPAAPSAPERGPEPAGVDQRETQITARNAQAALYKSPEGVAARQAMQGEQFVSTYQQAAAAFAQPPKAQPPVIQPRGSKVPLQYSKETGAMEEFKAPEGQETDAQVRMRRQKLESYEQRGGLAGLYQRGMGRLNK